MVPVLAVGFDALNARVEAQSAQATAQQEKLKELQKRLQALTATHTDTTVSRVHRALSQYTQFFQRQLKLIQHLHLLIPAVRSSSIRPEEEALRAALEEMEEDLRRPGGTNKIRSKLNELWALVGAVNAARERGRKAGGEAAVEWTVVDEDGLKQITQILSDQQTGLQHLTKILQRDLKDLGVIMGTNGEGEDGNMNTENRFSASASPYGSTSTLHASAVR
jgi:nuclear pore complex protein Nup54